jgi:hypothetical protein
VNELPLSQFRAMLIENFNVLFPEQKMTWPKRLAGAAPQHVPNPAWERTMHAMHMEYFNLHHHPKLLAMQRRQVLSF